MKNKLSSKPLSNQNSSVLTDENESSDHNQTKTSEKSSVITPSTNKQITQKWIQKPMLNRFFLKRRIIE